MDFRILGPLEVVEAGRPLPLGGSKQRALLAYLLLQRGEVVSSERLIDELWGERPPATAAKSVQVFVSRLRKVLGDGCLVTRRRGYFLELPRGSVDLDAFEALVAAARELRDTRQPREAADRLRAALALWRGPPLADLVYEPAVSAGIAWLEELRVSTLEERYEAELARGLSGELVGELEALVREHPLRERLAGPADPRALPRRPPGFGARELPGGAAAPS